MKHVLLFLSYLISLLLAFVVGVITGGVVGFLDPDDNIARVFETYDKRTEKSKKKDKQKIKMGFSMD